MRLKDIKYKIKFMFQRAKKGYADEDLFSMDAWFINTFPKMLNEFSECTCGYPCNEENLKEEVKKMPVMWVEEQEPLINKIFKKYDTEYDLEDAMCCWLLIILRMKYCFELCDEWNEKYESFRDNGTYKELYEEINKHKKEAFYLLEKYFFDLWW